MVWKTNFDRVFDDRILIPAATNHKRTENATPSQAVVKEHGSRISQPESVPIESGNEQKTAAETLPSQGVTRGGSLTLDQILDNAKIPGISGDPSDPPMATLQHIVGELNVMSQTLGLLVQRITLNEDRVKKLEEQRKQRDSADPQSIDQEKT